MPSQQSTQSSRSAASQSPPTPLLSILNVVVDHVMMEPCPLEPEEFAMSQFDDVREEGSNSADCQSNEKAVELFPQEKDVVETFSDAFPKATAHNQHQCDQTDCRNSDVQGNRTSFRVPVLRIFGPVLRNGDDSAYHRCTQDDKTKTFESTPSSADSSANNTSYSQQPQSGCLHIHGAYPYMLARPVVAGPDGSMHHGHYYQNKQGTSQESNSFSPKFSSDDSSKRCNIDWDSVESVSNVLEDVHQRLEGSLRASMENSSNLLQPQQANSQSSTSNYIRSVTIVTGRGFYTYCSGPPAPFLRVEYYDPSLRWRVKLLLERGLELSSTYHPDPKIYDYEYDEDELELDGKEANDAKPLKFRCYEAHIPYTMQVFKDYNLAGLKYVNIGDVRFRQPLPKNIRKRTKQDFLNNDMARSNTSAFFLRENVGKDLLWRVYEDDNKHPSSDKLCTSFHVNSRQWLKKQTSCDLEFDTTVEHILNVLDVMTDLPSPLEERQKIHWRAVPSLREIWEQERKRMKVLLSPDKDFLSAEENYIEGVSSSSDSSSDYDEDMDIQTNSTPQFTLNVKKNASVPGSRLAVKGVKQLFHTSDGLEDDFKKALKDILLRHDKFLDNVDRIVGRSNQEKDLVNLDDGIEALAALGDQFTQNSTEGARELASQLSDKTPDNHFEKSFGSNKYTMTQLTQAEIDDERETLDYSIADQYDENDAASHSDDDFLIEEDELGEEGFEQVLTHLASQAVESVDITNVTSESDEESHEDVQHYQSQFCEEENNNIGSDDESINDLQIIEDETDNSDSRQIVNNKSIRADEFVGAIELTNVIDSSCEQSGLPRQLVFEPKDSLRRGDIKNQSVALHPLPSTLMNECPPWFKFQWTDSECLPPVYGNTFLEPVVRPPSYNRVKSWVKADNSRNIITADRKHTKSDCILESADFTQMSYTQYSQLDQTQVEKSDPLTGLGQQGCRVQVSGGGGLKTSLHTPSTFTPMTIMSIEVHVQCRIKTSVNGQREIAMVPDSSRDAVYAVVYVFARDPGGGENIEILERGSILVMIGSTEHKSYMSGLASDVSSEYVTSERSLLLRVTSIVQMKDPDIIVSWDTQGSGIGYLVERGVALGKAVGGYDGASSANEGQIDIARLLGRIPKGVSIVDSKDKVDTSGEFNLLDNLDGNDENRVWTGSGLGSEWDDRVGAGAAASSIVGRIVICGWKISSEECKHPNASYQPAIVSAVLNKRIPYHDDLLLTHWYSMNNCLHQWRVIEYRLIQAMCNIMLLDELDVLGRAGEAARLSGVEFSQSLPGIRGSQYKVEGVLLRALKSVRSNERGEKKGLNTAAKLGWRETAPTTTLSAYTESQSQTQSPWKRRRLGKQAKKEHTSQVKDLGYFFYSPSKDDCSKQEALECQALTLEPLSGFHFDPVVVCDFTALYPSLVIAYNLCYSTIAGKLDYHSTRKEMRSSGKTTQQIGPFKYSERRTAAVIKHHMKTIHFSNEPSVLRKRDRAYTIPTGSVFVSESVLKGVLPQVLDEILSTRAMLKKAAKEYKKQVPNLSPAILRQIEARQLALKYVANVTYGYTSATFSGRSAAPLVADAIVECGRRTLTNAINLANRWGNDENGRWNGAQVLYGDTDSVFIKLPGRSVEEAFSFGEEYCRAVTASNPPPVQLKLEKVYSGSLLQTKKKYCGMMCESASQKHPIFEAKGIETVRRDQCALTQRVLRDALVKVFRSGISSAKDYLRIQWSLIHAGKFSVSDFVLTGRVRSRYRGGRIGPVQAALARRLGEIDPGRVVRHKERLPYVIVASPGKAFKLRDCVLTPLELLERWDSHTIHSTYYITKHVNAALQRCFGLAPFNLNVHGLYEACPKPRQKIHYWPLSRSGSSLMISSYFGSDICSICEQKCKSTGSSRVAVCNTCSQDKASVMCVAIGRLNEAQEQANRIAAKCSSCNGCFETCDTFAQEVFPPSSVKKYHSSGFGASKRRAGRLCNPIANCVCIDCPLTYLRHELRQMEIEASELMKAIT